MLLERPIDILVSIFRGDGEKSPKELSGSADPAMDFDTSCISIPPSFRPLTSKNAHGSVCSMGKLICSMLKASLEQTRHPRDRVDAVILMGGNLRGLEDYPSGSSFSLETLEAEVKRDQVLGVVEIPGSVLAAGIEATHAGEPSPGWYQYDDDIVEENNKVKTVAGRPLLANRLYRVATNIEDLTSGQSPPLANYFKENPELLPSTWGSINIHSELTGFIARNLFRKLWAATGEVIPDPDEVLEDASEPATLEAVEGGLRLSVLDRDNDGIVTVEDIQAGLHDFLGLAADEDANKDLARHVHNCADYSRSGSVTLEDFEQFCMNMPKELRPVPKWEKAFPDPVPKLLVEFDFDLEESFYPMKRHDTEATFVSDESPLEN